MKKSIFRIMLCLTLYLTISFMAGIYAYADNLPPAPINLAWDNGKISWEAVNLSKVLAVEVRVFNKKEPTKDVFTTYRRLGNYQYVDLTRYLLPGETYLFEVRSDYREQGEYDAIKSAWAQSGEYKVPGTFTQETILNLKFREDAVITWDLSDDYYIADYTTALYEKQGSNWVKVAEQEEIGEEKLSYKWGSAYTFESGKTYKASLVRQQIDGVLVAPTAWTQEFTYAEIYKICEQPKDVSVYVGEAAKFEVQAIGVSKYHWYFYDEMLEEAYDWAEWIIPHADYPNNIRSTITITPKDTWLDGKKIYCALMDASGNILGDSACATLHVSVDDRHKHTYTKVEQVASTCKDHGCIEYYSCSCGMYFETRSEYSDIKNFQKWLDTAGCLDLDPENHVGGEVLETTNSTHGVRCGGCGALLHDIESHQDINGDGLCDVCGVITSAGGDCYVVDISTPEGSSTPTFVKSDGTEYTDVCLAWMWNGPGGQYMACNKSFETWYRTLMGEESYEYMKNNFWIASFSTGETYSLWFLKRGTTEVKPLYYNGVLYPTHYDEMFGGVTASIEYICKGHTHAGTKVQQKDPTKDAYGVKAYYKCRCGQYYTDEACTSSIADLEAWKAGAGRIDKVAETGDTGEKVPAVGQNVTDSTGSTFVVTKAAKAGRGEVSFKKPKSKKITSATIPASITVSGAQYTVTGIEASAFSGCKKLTKVVIGKNVKKIKTKAFYKCTRLKSITIKTTKLTLKSVGKKAFTGIHKKAIVKVPKKKLSAYKNMLKKRGINGNGQKIKK